MIGHQILISSNPQGKFDEGTISGALLPGTWMEIKEAGDGGRYTWQARSTTTGDDGALTILLQKNQGQPASAAYVDGDRCFLYTPIKGERVNNLVNDEVGTTKLHGAGDKLGINNSGRAVANSSYPSTPLTCLEDVTGPASDTLVGVQLN